MVEVAMRLSQEDLHKILASSSRQALNGSIPGVLQARRVRAPELWSVLTLVVTLSRAEE